MEMGFIATKTSVKLLKHQNNSHKKDGKDVIKHLEVRYAGVYIFNRTDAISWFLNCTPEMHIM